MKSINYILTICLLLPQTFATGIAYSSSEKNPKADSTKIVSYIASAKGYAYSNADSSLIFIDSAIKLAVEAGNRKLMADAWHTKGIIYFITDKYDSALNNYYKALDIRIADKDLKAVAKSYNNIAITYSDLSLYKLAVKNNLEALKIHEVLNDTSRIGISLNNLAMNYHYLQDYETALKFYKEALEYKRKIPDNEKDIARTLSNIGQLFIDMSIRQPEYLDTASAYLFKAVNMREKINDLHGLSESVFNLGNIYIQKKDFKKALIFIDDAYQHFKLIGDKLGIAKVYFNMGYINYHQDAPDYTEAYKEFEKSVNIAKEINNLQLLQDNYLNISNIFKLKGQFNNAYQYMELYNEMKDSILTIETKKEILRLQIQYETKKRETLIAQQQLEIKKLLLKQNKLLIISALLGLLVISMLVTVIVYKKKKRKLILSS